MLDQTSLGNRFLHREFNFTPRVSWQLDPFGHSATQAVLLTAGFGADSMFFGRIDYQDRRARQAAGTMECALQPFADTHMHTHTHTHTHRAAADSTACAKVRLASQPDSWCLGTDLCRGESRRQLRTSGESLLGSGALRRPHDRLGPDH